MAFNFSLIFEGRMVTYILDYVIWILAENCLIANYFTSPHFYFKRLQYDSTTFLVGSVVMLSSTTRLSKLRLRVQTPHVAVTFNSNVTLLALPVLMSMVSGFLRTQPPIKADWHDITIVLKVAFNTSNQYINRSTFRAKCKQ